MSLDINTPITFKMVSEIMERIAGIIMKSKKVPQLVRVIDIAVKFNQTFVKRGTTTSNKFDSESPVKEFLNPLDRDTMVKEISFVGNAGFRTNGILKITIDDVPVFESESAGDFTDATEGLSVPLRNGKLIRQNRSVKILLKNDDNATSVSVAVEVTFGD